MMGLPSSATRTTRICGWSNLREYYGAVTCINLFFWFLTPRPWRSRLVRSATILLQYHHAVVVTDQRKSGVSPSHDGS